MIIDIDRLLRALGIQARRQGPEWQALCPLPGHEDKKPSWSIRDQVSSERHGRHHCFSCGGGGDAIQLVADCLDIPRRDAIAWMAESGVTSVPDVPVESAIEFRSPFVDPVVVVPRMVVQAPLEQWVSTARDYAAARRGITAEQVERWHIGYAIAGRCSGRLWFPVADEQGVLRSWTARSYTGSRLRYLTPTREEARHDAIFGAARWGEDRSTVVLTEGALNALACERAGAPNIAALNGSNVTPLSIAALSTFERIVVLTDPDKAGARAALEVVGALKRWRQVVQPPLPPGQDANDLPPAVLREILARTA